MLDTGADYHHPSLKGALKPIVDGKEYHTTHGTHVTGTILGRGNSDRSSDSGKVRGIAPQADLYAYRVLGPYGEGNTERTLRAIEHAVYQDQVDVLNLSIIDNGNFQYTAESVALDNATKAGVVVVVAAGNAGPEPRTLSTLGGTHAAISVAASSPPVLTPVFHAEGRDKQFFSRHAVSSPILAVDKPLKAVYAGFGKPDDYKNKDVKGKLVVVSHGEIRSGDKSRTAKHAGAVALIIFNNEAGDLTPELGNGNVDEFVPTYSISQADGIILKNYITPGWLKNMTSDGEKTVVRTDVEEQGQGLWSDSARGPALPDYTMKPDLAAPGVAITSSVPAWDGNYEHAYESKQGTSMAAPHIAGAAALLVEYSRKNNLALTPDQIKTLMMNHAVDLKDPTGKRYKLMEQGAGRVDLKRCVEASAIALVQETESVTRTDNPGAPFEYETGSLSFGAISPANTFKKTVRKKTVRLKSISNSRQPYSVSIDWDGSLVGSPSRPLTDGAYYLVPVVNGERLTYLRTPFLINNTPPIVSVDQPEIRVDHPQERKGKITGTVYDSSLDFQNFINKDFLDRKYSIQDTVKMKAVNKATQEEYKVNMNVDGIFTIDIPYLKDGRNEIDIYAWDSIKNGYETPSRTISFDFDPDAVYANLWQESKQVHTGEEFKVDIGFSVTEAVYSASFRLVYDASLLDVRVEPSVTFATYTHQQHPDVKLDFASRTIELDDQLKAIEVTISMPPTAAYSRDGILGTIVFSSKDTEANNFWFWLDDLKLESMEPLKLAYGSPDWIKIVDVPISPYLEPYLEPNPEPGLSSGGSSPSRSYSTPSRPAGKPLKWSTTVTGKDDKKQGLLLVSSAANSSQLNDMEQLK